MVVDASREFHVVAENALDDEFTASPAVSEAAFTFAAASRSTRLANSVDDIFKR